MQSTRNENQVMAVESRSQPASKEAAIMEGREDEVEERNEEQRDAEEAVMTTTTKHYRTKPGHFETLKIYFPTSEGVSKVSERANE